MANKKQATWDDWKGADVLDSQGEKVGSLENVYDDADSGKPTWLGVKTGLLGMKEALVPTKGVKANGQDLQVAHTKDQIKDAPNVDPEHGEVDRGDENEIWEHYGLPRGDASRGRSSEVSEANRGSAEASMTRSEEEMKVGTRKTEGGRVRLSKHVVTENVTTTVPVRKEVARIEREKVTDGGRGNAEISEEDEEIVLSQEEVVVDKQVVDKERVRLAKDVETEEKEVSGEVRKERIDVDEGKTSKR